MAVGEGNAAVISCYGREVVEDAEMLVAAGEGHFVPQIEAFGLNFQIATRLTSWFAVTEEATVDPLQPLRRERIPQALPAGLSAAGLGLRGRAIRRVLRTLMLRMPSEGTLDHEATKWGMEATGLRGRGTTPSEHPPKRHELRGRIVLRRNRELVVEITVDQVLAWDPSFVRVLWRDDTERGAEVDADLSTRPGTVEGGTVVRLALHLDETALPGPPARLLLLSLPLLLEITLEP